VLAWQHRPGGATKDRESVGNVHKAQLPQKIAGMDDVKRSLDKALIKALEKWDRYKAKRVLPNNGVLLWGPPGMGKTTLVQTIAASLKNVTFLPMNAKDIMSGVQGQSLKNLCLHFNKAQESQPCILFVDEIHYLFGQAEGQPDTKDQGQITAVRCLCVCTY